MSSTKTVTLFSGGIHAPLMFSSDAFLHSPQVGPETASLDAAAAVSQALRCPIGLPVLQDCAVPGDRVVVVADPATPALVEIVTQVVEELQCIAEEGVTVTILLPAEPRAESWRSLVTDCPVHMQGKVQLVVHNPSDAAQCGYLASSSGGNRVYLNKHLLDADLVVSIGVIGFDSQLGYKGTTSVVFPAFSDLDTIRETTGTGHPELTPDERRPMRELVDEIGWLLGTQFSVQVVPSADGGISRVFAGLPSDVQQQGKELLDTIWRVAVDDSFDLVVISVPASRGTQELADWKNLGNALDMACRVVEQGGRIAIVADLESPDGPAARLLRRSANAEELLKPLRKEPMEDSVEVTQLIMASQRAGIYLLSRLDTETVEDLGVFALESESELQRLIDSSKRVAVIPGANFVWCDLAVAR